MKRRTVNRFGERQRHRLPSIAIPPQDAAAAARPELVDGRLVELRFQRDPCANR